MAETTRAKTHRIVGGFICKIRGGHTLKLGVYYWHEDTGRAFRTPDGRYVLREQEEKSARRPACTLCWQLPGD